MLLFDTTERLKVKVYHYRQLFVCPLLNYYSALCLSAFFPFQPSRLSPSSTQQSQCHVASPALAIWQQITPSRESAGNVQICHVTQLCRVANTKKSKCVFDRAHTWEHTSQGSTSAMRKKVFGVGEYSPGWSWWRSSHPQGRGCRQLRPHSWRKWSSGWWSQMVWEEG